MSMRKAIAALIAMLLATTCFLACAIHPQDPAPGGGGAPGPVGLLSFAFSGAESVCSIDQSRHTVSAILPVNADLSALKATFVLQGVSASISGVDQVSGVTVNDFRAPLVYSVKKEDGSTIDYLVTAARKAGSRSPVIEDPQLESYDGFGGSIALSGDTLVVGAVDDDGPANAGSNTGAVYVFVRQGSAWIKQAVLRADAPQDNARFGVGVAIDGDTVVVGSPWTGTAEQGAAYVFVRNGTTWSQQAQLLAQSPGPSAYDLFGQSVAVSGNTIAVGDPCHNYSGGAHIYLRSGSAWSHSAYLAPGSGSMDYFGMSVALSGDTLLVASPEEDSGAKTVNGDENDYSAPRCGAAYVFTRASGTWTRQAYLKGSDCSSGDHFGASLSLDGNTAIVGTYARYMNDAAAPARPGAAYVFTRSGSAWSQQARLAYPDASKGYTSFGHSVCVSGNAAIIGAPGGGDSGQIYIFTREGSAWSLANVFDGGTFAYDSFFGNRVAISGGYLAAGNPGYNPGNEYERGGATVFH